ncbi:MAG: polysaccharide export protein [Acidaminococcaceae bacterium]|nr:polysaccharide export protein [Acidaminococcaceae bacterium]
MKKIAAALALCAALTFSGVAAAEEYIMSPGDQLQIYVLGHEDISSRRNSTDVSFIVRPDGRLDFPLVGEIDTTGLTVYEFTNLLTKELAEYIIDPKVTVNIAKLGTTRVFVLGEVKKAGMFELTKGHRVLDALGAAGGFTAKAAKKNIFLIRNGQEDNIEKLNFNNYLKKGDASQNLVLNEGDCLYLTANGKVNFFTEILPAIQRIANSWYYVKRTKNL